MEQLAVAVATRMCPCLPRLLAQAAQLAGRRKALHRRLVGGEVPCGVRGAEGVMQRQAWPGVQPLGQAAPGPLGCQAGLPRKAGWWARSAWPGQAGWAGGAPRKPLGPPRMVSALSTRVHRAGSSNRLIVYCARGEQAVRSAAEAAPERNLVGSHPPRGSRACLAAAPPATCPQPSSKQR